VALFIADFVLQLLAAPVRHRTVPDDIFGDAAQQQMRRSGTAMGFHDDHLAIQLHGGSTTVGRGEAPVPGESQKGGAPAT